MKKKKESSWFTNLLVLVWIFCWTAGIWWDEYRWKLFFTGLWSLLFAIIWTKAKEIQESKK